MPPQIEAHMSSWFIWEESLSLKHSATVLGKNWSLTIISFFHELTLLECSLKLLNTYVHSGFETLKFRKSSENYLIRSTVEILNQSCLMVGVYTSAVIGQVGELPINHRSRNSKAKGIPLYAKNQIYKKKPRANLRSFEVIGLIFLVKLICMNASKFWKLENSQQVWFFTCSVILKGAESLF